VRPDISQRRQCELLGINRSNLFYKRVEEKPENLKIMKLMDEEHLKHPAKGVEQMLDFLLTLNILIGPKRVRRLLRTMGIMAIYPQRNLSKLGIAVSGNYKCGKMANKNAEKTASLISEL